ncbi:MAG: hypothetical protein NVS3B7_17230 [Candidatus Elarobacter sp.]
MLRRVCVTALAFALTGSALSIPAPALAQDRLTPGLIDQCTGCRFPTDLHDRDRHDVFFVAADLNLNGAGGGGA